MIYNYFCSYYNYFLALINFKEFLPPISCIMDSFNDIYFTDRKLAIIYIKNIFQINKTLKHSLVRSSNRIDLICSFPNCCFRIVCKSGRVNKKFVYHSDESIIVHGIKDVSSNLIVGLCNGVKPSISSVVN